MYTPVHKEKQEPNAVGVEGTMCSVRQGKEAKQTERVVVVVVVVVLPD